MFPRWLMLFCLGAFCLLLPSQNAQAALLGNNLSLSGPGCRFPDVAFGSVSQQYLVVWTDYNTSRIYGRFVSGDGAPGAGPFAISEAPFGALFPAVAFNSMNNEFLVTWDDSGSRGGVIFGQRVRGSDGALMGTNFAIGTLYGGIRSAVAWSPVSNVYLVVYWGNSGGIIDVFGQRVSAGGVLLGGNFNISNDAPFSGYPAVAWGAPNQFLVTWDNDDGNIHGRRIDPASGGLLGSAIIVSTGGGKDRSCMAYDSVNSRWLVQFNFSNAGYSYDQYGQLVNTDGTLNGGAVPLAHTSAFEGDTQFGGDIAFVPGAQRYFSSFGTDTGMGGQESSANGSTVGAQVVLGTGYYTSLNNAADPQRNRFLTAWEGLVSGSFQVFAQLCATTLNPTTNFIATPASHQNTLSWRNPGDAHFAGVMIRWKSTGYPVDPTDGLLVVDQSGAPGASTSFTHTNLTNWITCYYSAFAHDVGPNYSLPAQIAATPRPETQEIEASDFTAGAANGWTFATWASGTLAPGTIVADAVAGNILSTGAGASNTRDACTHEGSIMIKRISTAGFSSIQVEYDVMAGLNAQPQGSTSGGCTLLEGSDEDKLVISYSVSGTNGPWSVAQILAEGTELPTPWTRQFINLAGIPSVNNNTNFALRFQWQFNSAGDTGRVDNIRILSGAVTAPMPDLRVTPGSFTRTIQAGQNHRGDIFRVNNSGEGNLSFSAGANVSWLNLFPSSGSSAGPEQRVRATYGTSALAVGDYDAVIQISSPNTMHSPQFVSVKVHIIPAACFWEPFDDYDGNLTSMGAAIWSGSASNQLVTESSTLKIIGGAGLVSASHAVACSGSNGVIAAQIKIRRGSGSGDFFWNIALDDSASNNLARWYGGSTLARGRVGNSITPDMPLTAADIWDDLFIKIDTTANTSEFFFNGVSYGVIPHGSTPANSIASVRFERLDRGSATGDTIFFDSLSIGALDNTPPTLHFVHTGASLELSWPAAGMGFSLQSTAALQLPIAWTTLTNGPRFTNGQMILSSPISSTGNLFFRLKSP